MRRRGFLRGLGLGAASLILPLGSSAPSRARVPGRPLRFVTIFTPNGTVGRGWGEARSETDFTLGPILEPFAALRDQLLVLDGLDMSVAGRGTGGGHQQGPGALLTSQPLLEGDFCSGVGCALGYSGWAGGPSIDQVIAEHLAGSTRLRSLELGVRVLGANNRHRIAYRAANDPLAPDDDPFRVYARLFDGAALDAEELATKRRERGSVLDFAREEMRALRPRLDARGRDRLDAHLTSIRDVEQQLDAAATAARCDIPELGEDRFDPSRSASYPASSRLQLELLATALGCDATRVATVLYSGATSFQSFPWLGIREQHHALSHEGDLNRDAQEKLTRINTWYMGEVARFCERLAATPEGDGTLLDHTVVFVGNELSKGNTHSHQHMRFVVLGGRAAGLSLGRWLSFDERPHSGLLSAFARLFGHPMERFGHPDFQVEPFSELTG